MGMLLAGAVAGVARLTAQSRAAEMRLAACEIADSLLANWCASGRTVPRNDGGPVSGHAGWTWRTSTGELEGDVGFEAEVVTLTVYAPHDPAREGQGASVQVQVLVSRKTDEGDQGTHAR